MSAHKWSLRYLFHKFREVTQKRARSRRKGDRHPRHSEKNSTAACVTSNKDEHPIDSKFEICQDQEKTVLKGSNHNYKSKYQSDRYSSTVEDNSTTEHPILQEPFEWLIKRNGASIPDRASDTSAGSPTPGLSQDSRKATKRLHHDQYTVGWICALPKEMTAAKAMLDEVHLPLTNSTGDWNTYQLGAIGGHNVVIACLRSGVYGTTSATAVAIAMHSTYPNSNIMPLMVGIGGGVPTSTNIRPGGGMPTITDIRLGDVVISTPSPWAPAVMQYDLGSSMGNGDIQTKGTLNKPGAALLSALSNFRSDLDLTPSMAADYIQSAIRRFALDKARFSYPGHERDLLFEPECEHFTKGQKCKSCTMHLKVRSTRPNTDPMIHHGTIGSGNQVIKHARIRDRIAKRHGILCFEMEAAGVMDYFPCLVIRGICDYCDTHKNKEWQDYAALAAAAVAKDFLVRTPPSSAQNLAIGKALSAQTRKKFLKSLDFEERYTRRDNVKQAHPQTCKWVLQQPQFLAWMTPKEYHNHLGLLWMKGKPGAGKSTVMKYLLDYTEQICEGSKTVVVVSFFFHARGGELARSTVGMYRSLIVQILDQIPGLQSLLDRVGGSEESFDIHKWTITVLEGLLTSIVRLLREICLVFYIDALDECSEDQIRDMVSLFDQLAELADKNCLYVCFASRHYPEISMKRGLNFVLENQQGHSDDIKKYLESELILDRGELALELKQRMYAKSGGIFLWTVLVAQILRREYDRGGIHKLLALLDEIPAQVDDLFRDILKRDNLDLPQLVTSLRWVLYAGRPLYLEELDCILRYPNPPSNLESLLHDRKPTWQDMCRYLLSCSKGMMEITSSKQVQFIHETMREFLLQPGALENFWPGFEGIFEGASHELLKLYCYECTTLPYTSTACGPSEVFSLQGYAIRYVFYHAEQAQRHGISQEAFIEEFDHQRWSDRYSQARSRPVNPADSLGICLAKRNCLQLLAHWVRKARIRPDWPEVSTLFVINRVSAEDWPALKVLITTEQSESTPAVPAFYYTDIFDTLVNSRAIDTKVLNDQLDMTAAVDVLRLGSQANSQQLNLSLHFAARRLVPAAIQLFLELGSDINSIVHDYPAMCQLIRRKPLIFEESMTECILLMTNYARVNVDICGKNRKSPLRYAIISELYNIIDILLDHGASVHMDDLRSCLTWPGVSIATKEDILTYYLSVYKVNDLSNMTAMLARHMNKKQAELAMRLLQTHADQCKQDEAMLTTAWGAIVLAPTL